MKRFGSSDSLVPFLYPQESNMQMMMDGLEDEESMEEIGHGSVKKRRLAVEQVQSLEKIFEVDNKLDPERKIKLAQELGLQPRQVAIWFQNRRARWKTKQLERDYNHLKANYENLQHSFSAIEQEKQNLVTELNGLKEKLQGKKGSDQEKCKCDSLMLPGISGKPKMGTNSSAITEFPELKDGSSDESDNSSNGFLKVQNNPSPKILSDISCSETNPGMCLSSSMYYPQFLDSSPLPSAEAHHHYHHQAQPNQEDQLQQQHNAKMELVSLFGVDESCNMFTVDQSQSSLYWYYYDQRI